MIKENLLEDRMRELEMRVLSSSLTLNKGKENKIVKRFQNLKGCEIEFSLESSAEIEIELFTYIESQEKTDLKCYLFDTLSYASGIDPLNSISVILLNGEKGNNRLTLNFSRECKSLVAVIKGKGIVDNSICKEYKKFSIGEENYILESLSPTITFYRTKDVDNKRNISVMPFVKVDCVGAFKDGKKYFYVCLLSSDNKLNLLLLDGDFSITDCLFISDKVNLFSLQANGLEGKLIYRREGKLYYSAFNLINEKLSLFGELYLFTLENATIVKEMFLLDRDCLFIVGNTETKLAFSDKELTRSERFSIKGERKEDA